MNTAIRLDGIEKLYNPGLLRRRVIALRGLNVRIESGGVYGLIGPNGAGKTTAFRILLGLIRPDAGDGEVLGFPLGDRRALSRIGYLPESPCYYPFLTVAEFLRLAGNLSRLAEVDPAVDRAMERFDLTGLRDRPLRRLSKGQLQRVGIAQAGLHDPPLLILDEPMSGLDPLRRAHVKDWIRGLRAEGRTVLLASHVLADVEALADRVGVLIDGRIVAEGTAESLLEGSEDEVQVEFVYEGDPQPLLSGLDASIEERSGLWAARLATGQEIQVSALVSRLLAHGGVLRSVERHRHNLESYYLASLQGAGGSEAEPGKAGR